MQTRVLVRDLLSGAGALAGVTLVVGSLYAVGIENPTIAALLLLMVVLGTATVSRLRVAVVASVAAMLAFNFFFLPPYFTFTIAEPQNWVALLVFLAVAIIASQLSAAARQRTSEANARRLEVSRLFDLSRDILLTTESTRAVADVARYVARRFELGGVAICLPGQPQWEIHQGGQQPIEPAPADLDTALARLRGTLEFDARERTYGGHAVVNGADGGRITLVPLRLGTKPVGLLATADTLEVGTLDALGGVVAIAIERAHFLAERARADALAQRADLASALLASFSHDLRTPLTAVRVAVANLQNPATDEERDAQAHLALTEIDRLNRLFQDILDMARIEASALNPDRQWVTPADIVDAAMATAGPFISSRQVEIDADGESQVQVDPRLTSSALAHLIENAARYSTADQTIHVRAAVDGEGLHVTVRDHGVGLDPSELERIFDPFHRSLVVQRSTTGTGLGLAIARGLLAAEDGRVWGENANGGGAQFTIVVRGHVRAHARQTP